jgi:hypothetical protein
VLSHLKVTSLDEVMLDPSPGKTYRSPLERSHVAVGGRDQRAFAGRRGHGDAPLFTTRECAPAKPTRSLERSSPVMVAREEGDGVMGGEGRLQRGS